MTRLGIQPRVKSLISPYSGRDCVKSHRSSITGLHPQNTERTAAHCALFGLGLIVKREMHLFLDYYNLQQFRSWNTANPQGSSQRLIGTLDVAETRDIYPSNGNFLEHISKIREKATYKYLSCPGIREIPCGLEAGRVITL